MRLRPVVRAGLAAGVAALAAISSSPTAQAQEIRIERQGCDKGVHVVARSAQASAVMAQLARTLGFQVSADAALGGTVNVDSVVPMAQVVSFVLPLKNVIISQRNDPDCPGRYRIARVWLLARGEASAPAQASAAQSSPQSALDAAIAAVMAVPVTPESRENDELYRSAHGLPPDEPATPSAPQR
jgi:hypothetical protein